MQDISVNPLPAAADLDADLLQLAVNCLTSQTAEAALSQHPSELEPTAARRLLVTAAVRHRDGEIVRQVAAVAAVQQHLDAPTFSVVLLLLLRAASWHLDYMMITLLLKAHRALTGQLGEEMVTGGWMCITDVPSDVLARLLLEAAGMCNVVMLCVLLHFPAARQLSDGDVMRVLRVAETSADSSLWHMCHVLMC
jgi:hypothetical protein